MTTSNTTTKRKPHKWGEPDRSDPYETVRTCVICGLQKITSHNDVFPVTWFREHGAWVKPMPECEIVE